MNLISIFVREREDGRTEYTVYASARVVQEGKLICVNSASHSTPEEGASEVLRRTLGKQHLRYLEKTSIKIPVVYTKVIVYGARGNICVNYPISEILRAPNT